MKKLVSILLSAVMLTGTAAVTANAATTDDGGFGAHKYVVVDKTTLKNGQVRIYTHNYTKNNPKSGISMINTKTQETNNYYFNDVDEYTQINVPSTIPMESWLILESTETGPDSKIYNKTGGKYEKIKIKLSNYSDYFNSDGTHTNTFDGFNYNFTTQKEGKNTYGSVLVFWSGGIFTAVTPSEKGYVEFYVSKNIGEETSFSTIYECITPTTRNAGGGITSEFNYFTMGNANLSSSGVTVDDVTAIQSYSAGIVDFDNLQKRNADVNFDEKIDVDDATMVQKYLAGLI